VRKGLAIGLVAAVLLAGIAAMRRHDILRFAIGAAAGAAGYSVTIARQTVGFDAMEFRDVHVSRAGVPLLDAARIDVRYSLRDLLPGSTRRFGVAAIDVDAAKLSIVRASDGTYNFLGPPPRKGLPQAQLPFEVDHVPVRFTLRMRDTSVELLEPAAYDSSARRVVIDGFTPRSIPPPCRAIARVARLPAVAATIHLRSTERWMRCAATPCIAHEPHGSHCAHWPTTSRTRR
jgi:hypothetical protein